jgi:hypothetical protein
MDYVSRVFGFGVFIFGIEDENHLQPSPTTAASDHPPLVLFPQLGVWALGMFDDPPRLFRRNAVFGNVFDVPLVPSENQGEPPKGILLYRKIIR